MPIFYCIGKYRSFKFLKPVISTLKRNVLCENVIKRERGTATLLLFENFTEILTELFRLILTKTLKK
jgi:hypothetical protein